MVLDGIELSEDADSDRASEAIRHRTGSRTLTRMLSLHSPLDWFADVDMNAVAVKSLKTKAISFLVPSPTRHNDNSLLLFLS